VSSKVTKILFILLSIDLLSIASDTHVRRSWEKMSNPTARNATNSLRFVMGH